MYLKFPAGPMFDSPKISERRVKVLYHLCLCVSLLSPFQSSQGLFCTSLRGLILRKIDPFIDFFFSKLCFTTCCVINQYIKSITTLDVPYFLLTISPGLINDPAFM